MTLDAMQMTELFGAISTVIAIIGVVLNNHQKIVCFYFWMVSNFISACIHAEVGVWSLLVRDVIFLILVFDGLRRWRKRKP